MADDLPVDYNPLRITVTPGPITNVPAGPLPVQYNDIDPLTGNPIPPAADLNGPDKLAGFVPWWQRMAVSGATAPGDAYAGLLPVESPTGYPGSNAPGSNDVQMEPRALPKLLGMGNFTVPSSESEIARVQDTAGMAGMSGIGMVKPGEATLGSGLTPPKKLYRGIVEGMQESGAEGSGLAHLGKGLYSSADKSFAKKYATNNRIVELSPEEAWPKNPLELNGAGGAGSLFLDYVFKNSEFKNAREFNKAYPDPADWLKEKGYDGVVTNKGEEVVKFPTLTEDTRAATGIGAINQSGFYSNLERTIANSKVDKATPEQWTSYLKNQPGIKSEELEFGLNNLPDKVLSKTELEQHIAENGVKLGEVWKGKPKEAEFVKAKELSRGPGQFDNIWEVIDRNGNGQRIHGVRTEEDAIRQANETYSVNNNAPKYSSYQLPGGENYRELLLTVPEKKPTLVGEGRERRAVPDPSTLNYRSSHWDEPNVLAHIRMNDRDIPGVGYAVQNTKSGNTSQIFSKREDAQKYYDDLPEAMKKDIKGNDKLSIVEAPAKLKTLHIEEIQSDWHQAGRKQGYVGEDLYLKKREELKKKMEEIRAKTPSDANDGMIQLKYLEENPEYVKLRTEYNSLVPATADSGGKVPNAPFKKSWDELALKRVLTEAVKNNYDAVSWTPGEAQAARYDLSKQVDSINVKPPIGSADLHVTVNAKSGVHASALVNNDGIITKGYDAFKDATGKPLSDVIGKEMAERIMKSDKETKFEGEGLKVGGEGMKAFYDKMLPAKASAIIKKMGGKVEYVENPNHAKLYDEGLNKARERVKDDIYKGALETMEPEKAERIAKKLSDKMDHTGIGMYLDNGTKNGPEMLKLDELLQRKHEFNRSASFDKIPLIRITPAMREKIKNEGFPLFTAPTYIPVDNDPFEKKQSKLVPVDHNPFIDESSF